jgi:glutaminyl-peptide cyclotransferase
MKLHLFAIAVLLLALSACQSESGTSSAPPPPQEEAVVIPKFERDSAYAHIEQQLSFGPRVPNTAAHEACKDWLVQKLESYGAKVIPQQFTTKAFDGTVLDGTNVIAQYNPEATKRILLAAHWDTRPFADSPISEERKDEPIPGADDGASGVAVLLEVARLLNQTPVDIGVDIVLFDVEDYGESGTPDSYALGAQYWARNPHVSGPQKPKYGILLDMVGSKNARFPREYYSTQFAPRLVDKVWKRAQKMGYSNYFVDAQEGGIADDHYYVNTIAKIPMIDIINRQPGTQTGFGEYWHTHDDDISVIDKRTLRAVGKVMMEVIYGEDSGGF